VVEQNAHLALKIVDYVHVMSKGQVVYSSNPEALRPDEAVKSNYLGLYPRNHNNINKNK